MITGKTEDIKEHKELALAHTERVNKLLKKVNTIDISNVTLSGTADPDSREKQTQKH
ncbi:MAG: hypothetical protein JST69_06510 [Bacteroidetes bacterium]|nr:hypothetical protein [Bacteroidota bacterium]